MQRHEVLDLMRALRLSGMRAAFDEIVDAGIERQHPVQRVKHHLSRQADLVRLVQSLGSAPQFRG